MLKIYTIGFTQKTARQFFTLLRDHHIQRVVDIRLKPQGQLAGFAKKEDLPYFLQELADGCQYVHLPELSPTEDILSAYRSTKNVQQFHASFEALMDAHNIPAALDQESFRQLASCLLCSEATPEQCHRRLVAERLARHWDGVEIVHL